MYVYKTANDREIQEGILIRLTDANRKDNKLLGHDKDKVEEE